MLSKKQTYDKENLIPALHKSICTGEQTAGFINKSTRKFNDVMLIRNDKDLKNFLKTYGVEKSDLKYDY